MEIILRTECLHSTAYSGTQQVESLVICFVDARVLLFMCNCYTFSLPLKGNALTENLCIMDLIVIVSALQVPVQRKYSDVK